MFNNALIIADDVLDRMIWVWEALLGLYDRCVIMITACICLSCVFYPLYSGPGRIAIPCHVFVTLMWVLALPFLSVLMLIEAGHCEGTARLIRVVFGLMLFAAFVLLIMSIVNAAYTSLYSTPTHYPYPPNVVPPASSVPSVSIA